MKITNLVLPAVALGGAAMLLAPAKDAGAFTTIGGSLSAEGQRDIRVFNNFADSQSNDNTTQDPNFPGWDGAELAFWKASAEWASEPFGDGSGDPIEGNVGDGGANFDSFWAGNASSAGGNNDNVVSAIQSGGSCGGGVIAYVLSPISDGWTMKFCDGSFVFWDGPGDNTGNSFDIQGIATHEYGHSLGLGHSLTNSATMFASASSSGSSTARSIAPDDQAGVQFIYGVKSSGKPSISSVVVAGTQVTITGSNFSTTGNEVWFTNDAVTTPSADPRVRITGVASTGGGTQIVVTIPAGATSGNIGVKQNATGHSTLSNMFPIDTGDDPGTGLPIANFSGAPTSGNLPLFVAFADTSTDGGNALTAWSWDFGDGQSSTVQFPAHIYNSPGSFDVSLTVTNSVGSDTKTVNNFVQVTGSVNASCTLDNGTGANPNVFTCVTTPILGTNWQSKVDGSSLGATGLSFVFGFASPVPPLPTAFGELLVNPTSVTLLSSTSFFIGNVANHSEAVANDSSLDGLTIYTQGFINGLAQLTNAQTIVLGN